MKKTTLLGIINLALVSWFIFILATSQYNFDSVTSLYAAFRAYASLIIILGLAILNAVLAYILLIKPPKKISFPVMTALTFSSLFWFIFSFMGFFFASHLAFPLVTLFFAGIFYSYFKRFSHKAALFLSIGTIIIMSLVMLSSFEEDHCWKQGTRTDPTGVKSVKATKDDAERLKKYGVTPGQEIGIAFRVHMLCHQTFSVYDAVTKSYFSH